SPTETSSPARIFLLRRVSGAPLRCTPPSAISTLAAPPLGTRPLALSRASSAMCSPRISKSMGFMARLEPIAARYTVSGVGAGVVAAACSWPPVVCGRAQQRRLQGRVGQPEVALGVDRVHHAANLLTCIAQQFEHADQHAV